MESIILSPPGAAAGARTTAIGGRDGLMTLRMEAAVRRGAAVSISVNGAPVTAYSGEMLAAALFAAGLRRLRSSPRAGGPRGMFCLMGACQECLLQVDGETVLACQEAVREGMSVAIEAPP